MIAAPPTDDLSVSSIGVIRPQIQRRVFATAIVVTEIATIIATMTQNRTGA